MQLSVEKRVGRIAPGLINLVDFNFVNLTICRKQKKMLNNTSLCVRNNTNNSATFVRLAKFGKLLD